MGVGDDDDDANIDDDDDDDDQYVKFLEEWNCFATKQLSNDPSLPQNINTIMLLLLL